MHNHYKQIGSATTVGGDENQSLVYGEPRRFSLRGNLEITELLNTLARSGVVSVGCVIRAQIGDGPNTFASCPNLRKGIRMSGRQLDDTRELIWRLGDLIGDAMPDIVEDTSAEGCDLLIEAHADTGACGDSQALVAHVTILGGWDPSFDRRRIELL